MINRKKNKPRIKIAVSITTAFIVVVLFSPVVFLANTPQLNPQFIADLQLVPSRMVAFVRNPLNLSRARDEIETQKAHTVQVQPENLQYTPVSKGVYAAEDRETGSQYVRILKGTKVEVRPVQMLDGRIIEVYVPVAQ